MMTYITAFIFYTMAMIGVMLLGFVIYKKTMKINKQDGRGMIKVIDSAQIAPKKMLLVVKVKNERFLIASGMEHTTFLSKLSDDNSTQQKINRNIRQVQERNEQEEILNNISHHVPEDNELTPLDLQKIRLAKIEKQFRDLYSENPVQNEKIEQPMDRREMVRNLLKDLDETTNSTKGSRF